MRLTGSPKPPLPLDRNPALQWLNAVETVSENAGTTNPDTLTSPTSGKVGILQSAGVGLQVVDAFTHAGSEFLNVIIQASTNGGTNWNTIVEINELIRPLSAGHHVIESVAPSVDLGGNWQMRARRSVNGDASGDGTVRLSFNAVVEEVD